MKPRRYICSSCKDPNCDVSSPRAQWFHTALRVLVARMAHNERRIDRATQSVELVITTMETYRLSRTVRNMQARFERQHILD